MAMAKGRGTLCAFNCAFNESRQHGNARAGRPASLRLFVPAQHAGHDAWQAYKRKLPHSMQQRKVTAGSR